MECFGLIILAVIVFVIGNAIYRAGKREGSRKGYGVGYDRGRRNRKRGNPKGCLSKFLIIGFVILAMETTLQTIDGTHKTIELCGELHSTGKDAREVAPELVSTVKTVPSYVEHTKESGEERCED